MVQREGAMYAMGCFQSASTQVVMTVVLDVKASVSGWFQRWGRESTNEPGKSCANK